jgi:hypothetical protein
VTKKKTPAAATPAPPAAPNTKPIAATGRTVTVACKIASGLALQLQTQQPRIVDTPKGPEKVMFWVKAGKVYYVHGPAYPTSPPPGYPPAPLIVGGYALTPGIPADFWEQWLEQNKLADYVLPPEGAEHGMIYAMPSMEDAVAVAKEQSTLLSGMEPLSQDKDKDGRLIDPRVPRPLGHGMTKIGPEPHPSIPGSTSISGGHAAAAA